MTDHRRTAGDLPAATPADGEETDEELLAGLVGGRLDALDRLYDRYRTMAFSIALRITNDGSVAEDVVQDAFLGVWRNAARYAAARGSVRTWLLSIVHHRAIDAVRRRRPTAELPDPSGAASPAELTLPDIWPEIAAGIDRQTVRTALATLSDVQREAIELAYFSGLTQLEIAERTNTPLGTVKSRIRLGLLTMRRSIVGEDPGLGEVQA